MNTQPEWLKDWRKLRKAGAVGSAFPSERWIEEWEAAQVDDADLAAMMPCSSAQGGAAMGSMPTSDAPPGGSEMGIFDFLALIPRVWPCPFYANRWYAGFLHEGERCECVDPAPPRARKESGK